MKRNRKKYVSLHLDKKHSEKMKNICVILLLVTLFACGGKNVKELPQVGEVSVADSLICEADTFFVLPEERESVPVEADELFDDFIFNYASDENLQRRRTVFPLPYYDNETSRKIEKEEWQHDPLFSQQSCYTLLFDDEEQMELVGDTSLVSVQVEWISLQTSILKKYYFERKQGKWMLEAINRCLLEQDDNTGFVDFYTRFATDSLYQTNHICYPLQFVTIDPDDEFSILETTLDVNQWMAFRPVMPTEYLTNINYGQRNDKQSSGKIMKVNGIGNGYSNLFYFRKREGEWELYKYEDTSI